MNFRISVDNEINENSCGELIYKEDGIQIESEFQQAIVRKNSSGTVICLGKVKVKNKLKSIDIYFNEINKNSFQSVNQDLEGRFILVLIVGTSLFICSDQFGKLDIYYQYNQDSITLASNFDLLPANPAKDGYNQAALIHTLTYYGYCPPKKDTLYNSVKRLGIDEYAHIQKRKLILTKRKFNAQITKSYNENKHDDYVDTFLSHLQDNASDEMNLVYLSSGWDSTSILAGLVHLFGKNKVSGVIGKMKFSKRSGCCNQIEIDKAKKFAKYYGIKLYEVDFDLTVENKSYFDELRAKMRRHQLYAITGLTHDKLAIQASSSSKNNTKIFAGEISDGAHNLGFSQYASIFHPSYGFREYSDKMSSYLFGPTFLSLLMNGQFINDPIYQLFKSRVGADIFDEVRDDPQEINLQLLTSFFLRNARLPLWSLGNEKILTSEGRTYYTQEMQKKYLVNIAKEMNVDNIYASYLYLYNSFHWQGSTVRSLQTMADYYQLSTDLPFWNSQLQDFLAKMPEGWGRGLDLNHTKYPLKKMLKDKLDYPYDFQEGAHSYTYDIDHSFNHAQEIYCYSALTKDFQNSVKDKSYHKILSKDYFDLDYIDSLVDEYIKSPEEIKVAHLTKLVPIIMLCYVGWYEKK